ncbi:MAG TPA: hypothetical protein VKZ85_08485 [Woeseiaceae bacterium]|nr:hypothetical protein [Woeseiaceae bacterium]
MSREEAVVRLAGLHDRLDALAAAGEWDAVARLLPERDALLRDVQGVTRERMLLEAQRSTTRLAALARDAHAECRAELLAVRRRRRAATNYVTVRDER